MRIIGRNTEKYILNLLICKLDPVLLQRKNNFKVFEKSEIAPSYECSSSIHFLNGGSYLSLISHLHTHCGDLPIKKFGYYIQAEDLQIYSFIYFLSFTCIKLKCLCNSTRKFHSYLKLKLSKTQFVICLPLLNGSSYSCILTW